MVEAQLCAISFAGDQLDALNHFLGMRAIEKKRIAAEGFMSEPPAAGLFPGEVLVEKADLEAGRCQALGAESSGWSSAHNGDAPRGHRFSSFRPGAGVG